MLLLQLILVCVCIYSASLAPQWLQSRFESRISPLQPNRFTTTEAPIIKANTQSPSVSRHEPIQTTESTNRDYFPKVSPGQYLIPPYFSNLQQLPYLTLQPPFFGTPLWPLYDALQTPNDSEITIEELGGDSNSNSVTDLSSKLSPGTEELSFDDSFSKKLQNDANTDERPDPQQVRDFNWSARLNLNPNDDFLINKISHFHRSSKATKGTALNATDLRGNLVDSTGKPETSTEAINEETTSTLNVNLTAKFGGADDDGDGNIESATTLLGSPVTEAQSSATTNDASDRGSTVKQELYTQTTHAPESEATGELTSTNEEISWTSTISNEAENSVASTSFDSYIGDTRATTQEAELELGTETNSVTTLTSRTSEVLSEQVVTELSSAEIQTVAAQLESDTTTVSESKPKVQDIASVSSIQQIDLQSRQGTDIAQEHKNDIGSQTVGNSITTETIQTSTVAFSSENANDNINNEVSTTEAPPITSANSVEDRKLENIFNTTEEHQISDSFVSRSFEILSFSDDNSTLNFEASTINEELETTSLDDRELTTTTIGITVVGSSITHERKEGSTETQIYSLSSVVETFDNSDYSTDNLSTGLEATSTTKTGPEETTDANIDITEAQPVTNVNSVEDDKLENVFITTEVDQSSKSLLNRNFEILSIGDDSSTLHFEPSITNKELDATPFYNKDIATTTIEITTLESSRTDEQEEDSTETEISNRSSIDNLIATFDISDHIKDKLSRNLEATSTTKTGLEETTVTDEGLTTSAIRSADYDEVTTSSIDISTTSGNLGVASGSRFDSDIVTVQNRSLDSDSTVGISRNLEVTSTTKTGLEETTVTDEGLTTSAIRSADYDEVTTSSIDISTTSGNLGLASGSRFDSDIVTVQNRTLDSDSTVGIGRNIQQNGADKIETSILSAEKISSNFDERVQPKSVEQLMEDIGEVSSTVSGSNGNSKSVRIISKDTSELSDIQTQDVPLQGNLVHGYVYPSIKDVPLVSSQFGESSTSSITDSQGYEEARYVGDAHVGSAPESVIKLEEETLISCLDSSSTKSKETSADSNSGVQHLNCRNSNKKATKAVNFAPTDQAERGSNVDSSFEGRFGFDLNFLKSSTPRSNSQATPNESDLHVPRTADVSLELEPPKFVTSRSFTKAEVDPSGKDDSKRGTFGVGIGPFRHTELTYTDRGFSFRTYDKLTLHPGLVGKYL